MPSGRACCSANAGGGRGARGRRKWCRGRTSNWRSRCASTSARSTWPDSSMSRSLKSLLPSGRLYALAPSTAAARTTPTIWIVRRAILLLRASAPPAQSPPPTPAAAPPAHSPTTAWPQSETGRGRVLFSQRTTSCDAPGPESESESESERDTEGERDRQRYSGRARETVRGRARSAVLSQEPAQRAQRAQRELAVSTHASSRLLDFLLFSRRHTPGGANCHRRSCMRSTHRRRHIGIGGTSINPIRDLCMAK